MKFFLTLFFILSVSFSFGQKKEIKKAIMKPIEAIMKIIEDVKNGIMGVINAIKDGIMSIIEAIKKII